MPSSSRTLPCIGIALVLVLLLSAHALAPTSAFAQSRDASATSNTLGPVHFIWTATRFNSSGGCTSIHSSFTDDRPQALLFVTPHWANDPHPIYVAYSSGGLWLICHADRSPMLVEAQFNVLVVSQANSAAFTTTTSVGDSVQGGESRIYSPLTDGNSSAQILVTQNATPNGIPSSTLDTGNLGVWYDDSVNQWAIFNENVWYKVPPGTSFNVLIGADDSGGGSEFYLPAASSNTRYNTVVFNNSLTNDNGNAFLFVTQNWNPKGGALNDNAIGVSYGCIIGLWCVYNQQVTKNIPLGAAFNVLVFPG